MPSLRRSAAASVATALLSAVALALPSAAVPCALDEPPAATLMLPYFEVDLDGSRTTLFSIGNAAPAAAMTRVTLWTDLGIPVLRFHVYLTGLDVQTINLRDVLAGQLPQTASPAADPGDDLSPQGQLSDEADFPGCAAMLPPGSPSPGQVAHLQAAFTGEASPLDAACRGIPWDDDVARGWVTVDVVDACTDLPPGPEAYSAAGGLGFDNVLWGDWTLVDPAEDHAAGGNLVRLEASPSLLFQGRTFYSTWVGGSGTDAREPLPTVWATRYGLHQGGGTDLLFWRDTGEIAAPFDCDSLDWVSLNDYEPLVFDEEENAMLYPGCAVTGCPYEPALPFLGHAGRVRVGGAALPTFFDFGWIYADLGMIHAPLQGVLSSVAGAEGRYSVATGATPLDAPCSPGHEAPGFPGPARTPGF